jgi:hypothetical protein
MFSVTSFFHPAGGVKANKSKVTFCANKFVNDKPTKKMKNIFFICCFLLRLTILGYYSIPDPKVGAMDLCYSLLQHAGRVIQHKNGKVQRL